MTTKGYSPKWYKRPICWFGGHLWALPPQPRELDIAVCDVCEAHWDVTAYLRKLGSTPMKTVQEPQQIELTDKITIAWQWPAGVLEYNYLIAPPDWYERRTILLSTDMDEQCYIYTAMQAKDEKLIQAFEVCHQNKRRILGWDRITKKPYVIQNF